MLAAWAADCSTTGALDAIVGPEQALVTFAGGDVVAGDCHLANTAIVEQTGRTAQHPLQVMARAYGIPEEPGKEQR